MLIRLEHANLQVKNLEEVISFLLCAFPEFSIRYDSGVDDPERWLHVGSDDYYLALNLAKESREITRELYSATPGFNHLAFVVDDVEVLRQQLLRAGYQESTVENNHPARKRAYFFDPDGNDWEFVEYLSPHKSEQNDYAL